MTFGEWTAVGVVSLLAMGWVVFIYFAGRTRTRFLEARLEKLDRKIAGAQAGLGALDRSLESFNSTLNNLVALLDESDSEPVTLDFRAEEAQLVIEAKFSRVWQVGRQLSWNQLQTYLSELKPHVALLKFHEATPYFSTIIQKEPMAELSLSKRYARNLARTWFAPHSSKRIAEYVDLEWSHFDLQAIGQ